jgi:hypothetical protein
MPIFLTGPVLGRGGIVLDGRAWLRLAFALLAVGFFDTSTFCFLLATYEASAPGRAGSVRLPHLLKNLVQATAVLDIHHSEGIVFSRPEAP